MATSRRRAPSGPARAHIAAVAEVEPRAQLRALLEERRELDRRIAAVVAAMRKGGASWHAVGLVAALTPEGARKRWGP